MATSTHRSTARARRRKTPSQNGRNGTPTLRVAHREALEGMSRSYRLQDDEVERALLTGEHAVALEAYFGEAEYRELRALAATAQSRSRRGGPRVLILPGIMGSKLGFKRSVWDDVIWVDPIDFALGNLDRLTLDGRTPSVEPLGVLLFTYLKLKLRLALEGFDADFFPYDWRQDLRTLGGSLAARIRRENKDVWLVAHSMGGLVARAALKTKLPRVKRLVMLGTPNYGSFAVPQALRGTYGLVRKIAAVDLGHTAEELAAKVFSSFRGLYQMMPWPEKFSAVDLRDLAAWPKSGPRPRKDLLSGIAAAQRALAAPDERFVLIAGVEQETVVDLAVENGEFAYKTSIEGDGTVPLAFARLPGVTTYYVKAEHGSLPNNGTVESAVADLLRGPRTDKLPTTWSARRGAPRRTLRDRELRVEPYGGRRGAELTGSEVRHLLDEVAAPLSVRDGSGAPAVTGVNVSASADGGTFEHVVVGRRRQHRLDVTLAQGSITEVDARAYVLGVFRDVDPSGAALALDQRLGGAISEFTSRRMISGGVGESFIMPLGRSTVRADLILFAGMGTFDDFTAEVLQLVSENVLRLFVRTHVEEFATVLFGTGSGRSVRDSLANMCVGFLRGMADADPEHRFRRVVLCEQDPARFQEMKQALYELAGSALFEDAEVTIDEVRLPAPLESGAPTRHERLPGGRDPVYLIVRENPRTDAELHLDVSMLGADGKATVVSESIAARRRDLDALLGELEADDFRFAKLAGFGARLGEMVLPPSIRALLATMKDRHLVVVHDAPSSRIPWETVHVDAAHEAFAPALACGVSRRYLAGNLSIAKWLESRREDAFLDVLLVVNPTGDLEGAEAEGQVVRQAFAATGAVKITEVRGEDATRDRLRRELGSGRYDVVHYAGHAYFDARVPSRSGIVCSDQPLTGADLASLGNLPSLVFFNACEAGRLRRGRRPTSRKGIVKRLTESTSFAEAFLRGGAANYVGTYWPVGDAAALTFSRTFYKRLLEGGTVSAALLDARKGLFAERQVDWADYIHYGSADFVVKTGTRATGGEDGVNGVSVNARATNGV